MTIAERIAHAESGLQEAFARIDRMEEIGTRRVLKAFQEHQVAYRHFAPTTGYGYDDVGRDTLERIFADLFGTEAAMPFPCACSACCCPATTYCPLPARPMIRWRTSSACARIPRPSAP